MNDPAISELADAIARHGVGAVEAKLLASPPLLPQTSTYGFTTPGRTGRDAPLALAPAAVLLPILRKPEPAVLLTRRTAHLPRHAGQVSFPGGRAQDDDASLIDTALRETQEEIGLDRRFVAIAGYLDARETGTGYAILPVVGIVDDGYALVPDTNEVDEIFEVPLAFLLDPRNRLRESAETQGRRYETSVFRYGPHYIWGATAAILVNLGVRLVG